jgi:hypothetical protein
MRVEEGPKPISKSNIKTVKRDKIDTPITQIHHHSLFWLGIAN